MSDTLSQDEVSALLRGLADGDVPAEEPTPDDGTARDYDLIGEDDRVVVRGRGEVRTKWGKDYNNSYCFFIRMADGRMVELREYLDTALVESVFGGDRSA